AIDELAGVGVVTGPDVVLEAAGVTAGGGKGFVPAKGDEFGGQMAAGGFVREIIFHDGVVEVGAVFAGGADIGVQIHRGLDVVFVIEDGFFPRTRVGAVAGLEIGQHAFVGRAELG